MEKLIAYHCAPALAGIKPANIVSCTKDKISDIHGQIKKLGEALNKKGIFVEALCECERRVLVMVYRKNVLERYLAKPEIVDFLVQIGYPKKGDVSEYIDALKHRMEKERCEFPHEIGAFLGYPLHDILGFIHHKTEGCLACGEWKVYGDVESAQRLFKRYSNCRREVLKRVSMGFSLEQIFKSA